MKKILELLILVVMVQSAAAIGIGIAPSEMKLDNALKGSEYDRSLTIFNTAPEATNFSLEASGNISDWVSFYDENNRITAIKITGKDKASVAVKIKVPLDAANANYTGSLIVRTIPEKTGASEGAGQSMIVGASSQVTIVVTGEQVIDGAVTAILTENVEPGYPLKITTLFQNTGNVVVKPKIDVTILQDKNIINSFTHDSTSVKPGTPENIIAEWKTTAVNIPANYTANVVVSLDGRILKSDNITFQILPVGTLTKSGILTQISLEGEPAIDTVVKIKAFFTNTGQIETPVKFGAEIYKDNKIIGTLSSDELTVPKYKEIVLISYLKLTSPGDYIIKGKVIFSGKETPVQEYSFKVPNKTSFPGIEAIAVIAVILAIVIPTFKFLNRKRNKK